MIKTEAEIRQIITECLQVLRSVKDAPGEMLTDTVCEVTLTTDTLELARSTYEKLRAIVEFKPDPSPALSFQQVMLNELNRLYATELPLLTKNALKDFDAAVRNSLSTLKVQPALSSVSSGIHPLPSKDFSAIEARCLSATMAQAGDTVRNKMDEHLNMLNPELAAQLKEKKPYTGL